MIAVLACLLGCERRPEDAARPQEAVPPVEAPDRPVVRPKVAPAAVSPAEYRESLERGIDMLLAEAGAVSTPQSDAAKQIKELLRECRLELKDHLLHDLLPVLRTLEGERDRKAKDLPPSHPELQDLARRITEAQSSISGVVSRVMPVLTDDDLAALGLSNGLVIGLGNGLGMELTHIPAGKFTMGSPSNEAGRNDGEGPQKTVTLSNPFYMGIYEVTQLQYNAVMGTNPSHYKGENLPVEKVSWDDAVAFCKKLSEKTGSAVRLPTEAEWEYACRAGSRTRYSFGDDEEQLPRYAWFSKNSVYKTHPVGQKQHNAWGLYDMHGNVYEWCSDWFGSYANAAETDPTGPKTGKWRVLRGGSWNGIATYCRSANRNHGTPTYRHGHAGFRVLVSAGVD